MLKQGEVCTECWAWGSVFGLLGVGAFYYDTGSMGRFCTCDWWKRGCRGLGAFVTGVLEVWEWAWGRFVTNDWRKRGGVFYSFFTSSGVWTGVGVGRFFTNGWRKRGVVFLFIFKEFDVFEQTPAWGVLSPMTDGSVGIGRGFIFYEFRWLDQSVRAWGICLRLKMIWTFWKWWTVLKTCEFGSKLFKVLSLNLKIELNLTTEFDGQKKENFDLVYDFGVVFLKFLINQVLIPSSNWFKSVKNAFKFKVSPKFQLF